MLENNIFAISGLNLMLRTWLRHVLRFQSSRQSMEVRMTAQQSSSVQSSVQLSVLRNREFRLLLIAQIVSSFGDSLTGLTLLILVNELTGSTAAIATLTILIAIPTVTLGLIAGVYVDRFDRKRIMLYSDAARAAVVIGLIFVSSKDNLWLIYTLSFLQATVGTFFNPARAALTQALIPARQLLEAGSISQTAMVLSSVAGSAVAGVLYGLTQSFWLAFVIDAGTFLISFALVCAVRAQHQSRASVEGEKTSPFKELLEGLQVIQRSRSLIGLLVATGVTMLGLGAVNVLFVPLLINVLQLPPVWLGAIEGAQTVGMILGGVFLMGTISKVNTGWLIVVGLVVLAVLVVGIGLAANVIVFAVVMFGIGLVLVPLSAASGAIMQQIVSNEMMGRVSSSFNVVTGAASLLSMALAGTLGAIIGLRNVFLVAGMIVALAAVVSAMLLLVPERKTRTQLE
jgi:MFS family permease